MRFPGGFFQYIAAGKKGQGRPGDAELVIQPCCSRCIELPLITLTTVTTTAGEKNGTSPATW